MIQRCIRIGIHICQHLHTKGLLWSMRFYWGRLRTVLYSRLVFGRWDINVDPDARVNGTEYMEIGRHFRAGRGLWLEAIDQYGEGGTAQHFTPRLVIGDNVSLSEYVHIGCVHHIEIGNDVLMGSKIYITDHNHGVYRGAYPDSPDVPPTQRPLTEGESIIIEDNVWIGEFCTILPGVTIGYGSIIGSHTTVTHDIPPKSIAVGSPAKVIKQWDEEKGAWVAAGHR